MRYVGKLYRPPSEADALILQATIGCSWNKCVYCDMYRDKPAFRVRPTNECLEDLREAAKTAGPRVEKVFVADGDALVMSMKEWEPILEACNQLFPRLRRVSAYAMASNVLEKTQDELNRLRELGLRQLYLGPESGDPTTLRRIVKGSTFEDHAEAAAKLKKAGIRQSVIFLLGAGGAERSEEHAKASARLATEMDPEFLAALTMTVVPNTPLAKMESRGKYLLPKKPTLLRELRTFIAECQPSSAVFRTNHASNYLPIGGLLPRDREQMLEVLDAALEGKVPLRPERRRGL